MPDAQTVTVLFTDMVGSTALLSRLGDEEFDGLRRAHAAVLRDALGSHNGTEVKSTGDGVMAVFASASDAASAAVTMQRLVARLNQRRPDHAAGVKIGISVGDATSEDGDWFGVPVVEAARLCDAAADGEILATEVVRVLAGNRGGHRFDSLGSQELKGLAGPVAVCAVRWEAAPDSAVPLPPLFSLPEPFPFAGRTRARKTLRESWDAAVAGERRVTLIAGEPGVGKTRLIGELAREVHETGAVVIAGRCDAEVENPLGPWAEALDQLARGADAEMIDEHVGEWGDALTDLVASIAQRYAQTRSATITDPDAGRRRLFSAAIDLIDRQAARSPVLLVIDDLHWADASSLLLLRAFVQHSAVGNVLVVGTYRDTDLDRKHPLSGMLADFRRETGVERIGLRGLDGDEVVDYLTYAGGRELTEDGVAFAHQLSELTAGNPFFVGQMLRHLSETNLLVQQEGRWIAGPVDPSASGVPEGVREVIGRRLSALDPRADHLFAVAAVMGSEFDLATLSAVAEMSESEVLDLLDEGMHRSLLVEEPGRFGVYRFAHALVRQTLLEELSTTRRIHLHRTIASHVAASHPELVEVIAHHFVEAAAAGAAAEAVEWASRAGERAVQRLAYEAADDWYNSALEAEALLPADDSRRTGLLLERARARSVFDPVGAKPDVLAVIDRARALDEPERFTDAVLAYGGFAPSWVELDDPQREPLVREALQFLPSDDSVRRVKLLARLSDVLQLSPKHAERRALCDEALAMARRLGDPDLVVNALVAEFFAARGVAGIGEREAWLAEMDELAYATGPGSVAFRELIRLMLHRIRGEFVAAREAMPAGIELARKAGLAADYFEWSFELTELVTQGRFADAEQIASDTETVEYLGDLAWLVVAANRAVVLSWCETSDVSQKLLTQARERFPEVMSLYALDATAAVLRGDLSTAAAALERWVELLPFIPVYIVEHVIATVTEPIWATGAVEVARQALQLLEPLEDRRGTWFVTAVDGVYGPAERTVGVLHLAAGDTASAVSWLSAAVASAEVSAAPPWIADSRTMLAHALSAHGDHEAARAVAAEARAEADALGMTRVAARAAQLL